MIKGVKTAFAAKLPQEKIRVLTGLSLGVLDMDAFRKDPSKPIYRNADTKTSTSFLMERVETPPYVSCILKIEASAPKSRTTRIVQYMNKLIESVENPFNEEEHGAFRLTAKMR